MEPGEKKRTEGQGPVWADRLRLKALGVSAYAVFLILLLAGIEGAARVMGARSRNPNLHRVL